MVVPLLVWDGAATSCDGVDPLPLQPIPPGGGATRRRIKRWREEQVNPWRRYTRWYLFEHRWPTARHLAWPPIRARTHRLADASQAAALPTESPSSPAAITAVNMLRNRLIKTDIMP